MLPKPLRKFCCSHCNTHVTLKPVITKMDKYKHIDKYCYYWLNTDKTRKIELRGSRGGVFSVSIYDGVDDKYLDKSASDYMVESDKELPPKTMAAEPSESLTEDEVTPSFWYWEEAPKTPEKPYWLEPQKKPDRDYSSSTKAFIVPYWDGAQHE